MNLQRVQLSKIARGISSWEELEARIIALPSEQERGEAFEQFCHAYFVLNPLYQFKEVYRHEDIPHSIRAKIGYPTTQDIGIDGIAVTEDEKIYSYQAKFRSDRHNTPSLRELSTFFTVSDKTDWRITITNANKLPKAINDRNNQSQVLANHFDELDRAFFKRLEQYLDSATVVPQQKRTPHRTQAEAIEAALAYFETNKRGQLILPCGTGKTLAALWIAEKLGGSRILVMVPSLSLMSQTLKEWATNTSIKPFRYLCLCSDPTVDLEKDEDAFMSHIYEVEVPVTTDAKAVREFLTAKTDVVSFVFSTYQSGRVLSEAVLSSGVTFDLTIFDEAHRTTGAKSGVWNLAIDDRNVPSNYRLFMTATPRIYAPHITKKAMENDIPLCSMDDEALYGKPFYELSFGDAIQRGHITDYKVVVICVTDKEVRELIEKRGTVIADTEEWDANALAKRVAIVKGIQEYDLRKAFTFHSRVKSAKAFTSIDTPYGISKVFDMISTAASDIRDKKFLHINGGMSTGERSEIMKEFKKAELAIMSNAHCLTEGVDVPAVDTVAFIDPKQSLISIVQASGRALRTFEEGKKERGYIFIPVFIPEDENPNSCLESSDFKTVWNVLQAMSDQDQRLQDVISQIRIIDGKGEKDSPEWDQAMREYSEKMEFNNIPPTISKTDFINALHTKSIEMVGKSWDFWFGLTLAYMRENNGDSNAASMYLTEDGYKLGSWQRTQRVLYKNGSLSVDRIKKLEEIGFIWNPFDAVWEKGFEETLKYKNQNNGDPNVAHNYSTVDGYKLGGWQNNQRSFHKRGKLLPDRKIKLEEIGFVWGDSSDNSWEKGLEETLKYKEQFGTPNVPAIYSTSDGYNLGAWQNTQRQRYNKNTFLYPDRIKRLEDIGFVWNLKDTAWENGFEETLKYKEQFATPNAPLRYSTSDGFNLGLWQQTQKANYKKGELTPDKIQILEEIGFIWRQRGKRHTDWEDGFEETLKYKKLSGNANAPHKHVTSDKYHLGQWQYRQRALYKNSDLSTDRIKSLEEVGFVWDHHDTAWEMGFEETLMYKEQFGTPNAPINYGTSDGFNLASWQTNQRTKYKQGTLSIDRIKRLDDIGFIWNLQDAAWEKGFEETLKHKEQFGNPNAPPGYVLPDKYRLAQWQTAQRANYKKGTLSQDRIKRLEQIGFWNITETSKGIGGAWNLHDTAWEKGLAETLKFKEQFGNPNAPPGYVLLDKYRLAQWQAAQRANYKKGTLSDDRIYRLEKIGFVWNHRDKRSPDWEIGFEETLKYKESFGDPNAHIDYVSSDKYRLGQWQAFQRERYKKDLLSEDRIRRLEEIGFIWGERRDIDWEIGFEETLKYKKPYGDPNVHIDYVSSDGFMLGAWQNMQRADYKQGVLSPERISSLEDIGFVWSQIRDIEWEKGIEETYKFKELFGNPNAPIKYALSDGWKLGTWQAVQRTRYKKGTLSDDRIEKLEEIGFRWKRNS